MKGDKNMLYFYCCELTNPEGEQMKVNGYTDLSGRIKKRQQLEELQDAIRQEIRKEFHRAKPHMNWKNAIIVFLAFNPL